MRAIAVAILVGSCAIWLSRPAPIAAAMMRWIDPYCTTYGGGSHPGFHWWSESSAANGFADALLYIDEGTGFWLGGQDPGYQQVGSDATINLSVYGGYGRGGNVYQSRIRYTGSFISAGSYAEDIVCW